MRDANGGLAEIITRAHAPVVERPEAASRTPCFFLEHVNLADTARIVREGADRDSALP